LLETAIQAAKAAAEIIKAAEPAEIEIHQKAPRSLVTNIDLAAERVIVDTIRARYPDHSILSEEMGAAKTSSEYLWVIDPLDGTANFSSRIPIYSVGVALAYRGQVIAAAVIDPNRNEVFTAERGSGAHLNGKRIHVGDTTQWENVVLGYDAGYSEGRAAQTFSVATHFRPVVRNLRTIGSAVLGLTWVAAGRFDIYIHSSLAPWDLAAGWLLIEEAGGRVTNFSGGKATLETKAIITGNPTIQRDLLQRLPAELVKFPD
jgi:myo-inositol-1(or 4)-monophosphatase